MFKTNCPDDFKLSRLDDLFSSRLNRRLARGRNPKKTALVEIAVWSEDPLSEHCCPETRTTTIMSVRKKTEDGRAKKTQCMNRGYLTPNSTYDVNRRLILSSLPSNVTAQEGFFFNGSIGQEPNRVYAIGMCLPGSTSEDCSACIKTRSDGLIQSCANQTEAYSWPGDPILCRLFFKDVNSNPTEFKSIWEGLIGRMIDAASTEKSTTSSSNNHYIADVANWTSFSKIYALVQCTPDLSPGDCDYCLRESVIKDYQSCCGLKQGVLDMRPSCLFRWELYPFFKAFDNISVASPPPPPLAARDHPLLIRPVLSTMTIEAATNKFSSSNKLGEGGFGEVYKLCFFSFTGICRVSFQMELKWLSKDSGQGIREFKNEAVLVSKLQHKNLVRLHGFCVEGEEKILIYEFVPNKSLNHFIFGTENESQLDWTHRYKIIEGIARGILYLHQDSQLTIIHRDLKPSNVLLDANMNPQNFRFWIVDHLWNRGNSRRYQQNCWNLYAMHGQYSMKSDVYSFGVLVLEIISGKKNSAVYQMDETSTAGNLVTNVLVDPAIGRNYQRNEVTRCIHIALLCVQDKPEDRPLLSTIILMLTSKTITLPKPRLPSLFPAGLGIRWIQIKSIYKKIC
ncbi:hypothetical protein YC2023_087247 [Brassica napus]